MAKLLKLRRGTTTQHGSFTGAEGEVTIDTDKDVPVVHDGSTQGGHPVAAEDLANVSSATIAGRLNNDSLATSKIAAGALPTDVTIVDANISGNLTIANADINADAAIAGSKLANPISLADDHKISFGTGSNNNLEIFHESSSNTNEIIAADGDIHIQADNFMLISDSTGGRAIYLDESNSRLELGFDGTNDAYFTGGGVTFSTNVDANAGIDVTGAITSTGDITITNTNPKLILNDSNNTSDFEVQNDNGNFNIEDTTNTANRLRIDATGGVNIPGNTDFGAGIDVTGNITVTGNVDGKDISALGITGTTLANGVTATTQSASDNSTKVATTAYTDTAISNLVDSSPSTLNTLNELAAALGDDANFSTTVTNSIATKLPLAGGTLTGALTGTKLTLSDNGASSPILNIKTDDGGPWGLRIGNDTYSSSDSHGFMTYQNNDGNVYFDLYGSSVYENWYFRQSNGSTTYTSIHLDTSGAVNLNYAGNTKGYTTSSGWSVNGNMVATGNVTAYSDARLKENVKTINDALGICGKLRGVSYKWKDMDKTDIGVIAQEVETVLPDIVLTNYHKEADGTKTEIKSVDYGKITSVLINAINELKAEVDALKGGS